ncbi:MAG: phosphodiesterase [Nitratireductor sp.]|nr:phosphodiesterase [Nitratireductor sp.]
MARILQLTDLHLVAPGALVSGVLDTGALLRDAVDRLLELLPQIGPLDTVLVTGDVSDDGSPESYVAARGALDRLGLPVLVVPGNHDDRENLRAAFGDMAGMPQSGLIDWSVDVAGTPVIGLDTLVEGQGGGLLRPESLALLATALERAGTHDVLIALHHPPMRTGIRFMDAIGLANADAFAEILNEFDGTARIVAGHVHGVYQGRIGRHAVLAAPSTCSAFALDCRANAPVGFMTGPRGCAVIDTAPDGAWTAIPLESANGPFSF